MRGHTLAGGRAGLPEDCSAEEKFKFLLRYAILAPSAHNTQEI